MNGQKPAGFPPAESNQPPSDRPPLNRPTPPPPPPPEITLRTMKSDLESIKQTGGTSPAPKPFTPPELSALGGSASGGKKEPPITPPPPPPPPKITPSEFGVPKKEVTPSKKETKTVIEEESSKEARGRLKKVAIWGGVTLIVVAVGFLGYFVIFPLLFPPEISPPPPPAITPPTTEIPEVSAVPEALEVPSVSETPILMPHQSLLVSSDTTSQAQLSSVNLLTLTNALQQEAGKALPSGTLTEIVLNDANGQVSTSLAISALLPELTAETLKNIFEEDFTTALYYDENGVWPIYILKLNLEASIVEAQAIVSALEQSQNLSNLFLASPGTANVAGFKIGQANNLQTRYLTFSKKGAALNLAWKDDKFVISASYNGLKKVISNL